MKQTLLSLVAMLLALPVLAVDTTPPELSVPHAWVEKVGTQYAFKLLLDPQDETGVDKIQYRYKVNSTLALPDATPWVDWAWQRGTPLRVQAAAKSFVIEVRALDVAGNPSPLQRRAFASPFPVSAAPNLEPKFVAEKVFAGSGPTLDCRGLYGADFDGDGRDDVLQVDRASGIIKVRRQQSDGTFVSNGFTVATNAVTDSAMGDFNGDGRPDLALVINGALVVYQNDGLNVTTLQFSVMGVTGLATTGITTVVGVAAGDVTGEGKDDLIITGTGASDKRVAILLHNAQFQLGASNYALLPATSTAGAVRLGDVTGDGWTDAVMIDAANNQVLTFMNRGNGSFYGADDVDTAVRPIATSTGSVPAQSIAVGDVTGDGRADMVITKHQFGDFFVTGEFRDNLFVQFFDSRGAAPFRSNGLLDGGFGPVVGSSTAFRSDVMLMDLNDDRFPEIVIASPFIGGTGGVRAWRMNCLLDNANLATFVDSYSFSYTTGAASPHRLASGRFQSSRADVLLASGDNAEAVQFVLSTYSPSSKTYDLITGASTDSDESGSVGTNGALSYSVDVGGVITYSLHYVNNTTTAVAGAVVECLLPASLSVLSGDSGYTVVPSGTSNYIRWNLGDVAAGTSGVKPFSVRVLSGRAGISLALKGNFKRGTTVLVTKPMPVVTLEEPLSVNVTKVTTSSPINGDRVHIGETITYTLRVRNLGTGTISGFQLAMSTPANTTLTGTTPSPTIVTGTYPNITAVTWTNLALLPNGELTREVRVQVKPTVLSGTLITSKATATRADLQTTASPAVNVPVEPPLEITLSSDKGSVQPGDTIRYTFKVQNWLNTPFTNAKVVDKLPLGVALVSAATNDAVDAPDGKGNFVYTAGTTLVSNLRLDTSPSLDRTTGILTWSLGTVPANAQRDIQFEVVVAQDIPTTFNFLGVSTPLDVQNRSYNLVGTSSGGARIFAGTPAGGAAANALTATSDKLLSSALPVRRSSLIDPPLAAPSLVLYKTASGNFSTTIAGESYATVINDAANPTDGICEYKFIYENAGSGAGVNVVIHDYIPTGMTFIGSIKKNLAPIPSLVGYRFFDAAGKEMQVVGAEGYTDANGNGFYDFGERFDDPNGNKKYDGVIASLVRSIDFPAGNVAGNGGGGFFSYSTRTTSAPDAIIISDAGGLSGVKEGLTYTKVKGYHITADNLHFPSNGNPKQVKVKVTGPAIFKFPDDAIKSRIEMVGETEITEIGIPFKVLDASSLTLSGCKMTVTIPKGFLVPTAELRDYATPTPNVFPAAMTRSAKTGITTLTFPIDFRKEGDAVFQVQIDPATKSVLKGTNGQITAPLRIEPTITGGYMKGTSVVPITKRTELLASLQVRDTVTPPPGPPMARGVLSPPPSPLADAKIFVGRCAPVFVDRNATFSYTIFVGNLTDLPLSLGTIEMYVPKGCDYVSASLYNYNVPDSTPSGDKGGAFGIAPVKTVVAGKGTKVSWNIGAFAGREGGAVTLTVKVRDDFSGTRIDDNTCVFDVINACGKTPGPIGVIVRSGNEKSQSSEIIGSAASGLGITTSTEVTNSLLQNFTLQAASCSITTGGTDLLQLNNGVAVIQLGVGRVMTVGPPDKIVASGIRLVKDDAKMRIAVGPGDSSGVRLTKIPTLSPSLVQPTNTLLANLHIAGSSLVAAGGGNMVAAGGGNMVAAGGGNLIGNDGSTLTGPNGAKLIGNDGSTFTNVAPLVAAGGGNLIGNDGSTLVAAGGGNMVAAGGGNIVATGSGRLIGNDGSTVSPLVAAGGGNLIAQDSGRLVAAGGGNLVAAGGGNLVAAGGLNLIPNK